MFFWLLTSDYFVVSNEYASGKCIGVKVYILIRKCSGVKVKVGWNIKTQVKYRYSQKILKYCNEVLLLCYNTPLVINHWLSELFKAADSFTNETLLLLGDAHQGHVQPGQNGGKRLLNGIGGALNSLAVSQYAFFSDLASLCSRSTSSSTVEVQFQFSRTQVQRTHESARMCSWYRGCIECRLERIEPLEIPEDAAGGRCTEACKL